MTSSLISIVVGPGTSVDVSVLTSLVLMATSIVVVDPDQPGAWRRPSRPLEPLVGGPGCGEASTGVIASTAQSRCAGGCEVEDTRGLGQGITRMRFPCAERRLRTGKQRRPRSSIDRWLHQERQLP
jgi:hypothetical protein